MAIRGHASTPCCTRTVLVSWVTGLYSLDTVRCEYFGLQGSFYPMTIYDMQAGLTELWSSLDTVRCKSTL